jgi:hypothetical protein
MNTEFDQQQRHYDQCFRRLGIDNILDHYLVIDEHSANDQNYLNLLLSQTSKKLLLATDSNPIDLACYEKYNSVHSRIKVLSGNIDHFFQDVDYVYFPHYFVTQLAETNYQTPLRRSRFSFLSRHPRPHRLYLYQTIKQYITDSDCFSIHANQLENFQPDKKYTVVDLTSDIPYYTALGIDLDYAEHCRQNFYSPGDHTNQHNAYSAYFYITGESNDNDNLIFLSEKTWKSFRSYCLPIMYGNIGSKRALEQLGFCLDYDMDENCLTKASWIADCMHNWDLDYCENFYKQNIKIVQHNFDYFYSDQLKNKFLDYLKLKLEL